MRSIVSPVIALFLFLPLWLTAQDLPIKFGKVPREDLDMKVYPPDTSAAAVVLCDFGSLRFEFKDSDPFTSLTRHKRIKILRRAGFGYGDIHLPFYTSMMKIKNLKAQIFAPDGTATEVPKKDIFEEKINDKWSLLRFAFPNLSEGCVVEYRYELETDYIFELPEWYFQGEIPVRWSELRLVTPLWYQYVTITNGRRPEVVETKEVKESFILSSGTGNTSSGTVNAIYARLAMKDVPALKKEAYITTMDDYYARIRFQLKSIQYNDSDPKPILNSWGQTATRLLEDENFGGQFTKKSKYKKAWEAAQSYAAAAGTPGEKIEILYQFVQKSIECEGGYLTYFARNNLDDLFEKKSASASEMNLLLIALLREAGVQAHPVLISTRDHGQPVPEYPIMDQFNHVLALAENGDKTVLLDAGNSFRPPGMIAINSLNREGWKVHATQPEWIPLAPLTASETYYGVFRLDDEGTLKGKIQTTEEGYSAMERRSDYHEKPPAEYWKTELQKRYPDVAADSMSVDKKDEIDQPLREKLDCVIPGYAQVSGDFIYFNPTFISKYFDNPFKLERRIYPVDMAHPFKERVICEVTVPPGYRIESLPESVRLNLPNNGGRFQYIIEHKEGKITLNAIIHVTQLHYETEEYDTLRTFFGMIAEKYGAMVVLRKD